MYGISLLAWELQASQERQCSMVLISYGLSDFFSGSGRMLGPSVSEELEIT